MNNTETPERRIYYKLFIIHYSLFIEPHVSEVFLAFHATFDTIFIKVDERQQKHPSFSF